MIEKEKGYNQIARKVAVMNYSNMLFEGALKKNL